MAPKGRRYSDVAQLKKTLSRYVDRVDWLQYGTKIKKPYKKETIKEKKARIIIMMDVEERRRIRG
eukprot:9487020-Pyramimonas_sp.AAC.1